MTKTTILLIATSVCIIALIILVWKPWNTSGIIQNMYTPKETATATTTPQINNTLLKTEYVEIIGGCGPYSEGVCRDVHSGPSSTSSVVTQLRNNIVLKVASKVTDATGMIWYKIAFEHVRYPERILSDWYIPANSVRDFFDVGDQEIPYKTTVQNGQHIVINLTTQILYAYDNNVLFMQTPISTGFELTPTLTGTFSIYIKTPSRYMQGPQAGMEDYYDLPGVPWDMYFTSTGAAIHGAYWHNNFGKVHSHGCINLPPDQAQKLYEWAQLGTVITIEN